MPCVHVWHHEMMVCRIIHHNKVLHCIIHNFLIDYLVFVKCYQPTFSCTNYHCLFVFHLQNPVSSLPSNLILGLHGCHLGQSWSSQAWHKKLSLTIITTWTCWLQLLHGALSYSCVECPPVPSPDPCLNNCLHVLWIWLKLLGTKLVSWQTSNFLFYFEAIPVLLQLIYHSSLLLKFPNHLWTSP